MILCFLDCVHTRADMDLYKSMATGQVDIIITSSYSLAPENLLYAQLHESCHLPRGLNTSNILFLALASLVISSSATYSTI